MRIRVLSSAATALALGAMLGSPALGTTEIGGVSASNPLMEAEPGTPARRALVIGDPVIRDELIATSADGSGQLLFIDQTTLSIAPDSRILLDEYVYDPDRSTGSVGLSVARGALRFIGGRITKLRDAVIGTPAATIGIRGGAVYTRVAADGSTEVIQLAGERTTVSNEQGQVTLTRPTTKAFVRPGEAPRIVGLATPEEIDERFEPFEGGGGGLQTGLGAVVAAPALDSEVTPYGSGDPGRDVVATNGGSYDGDPTDDPQRFGLGLSSSFVGWRCHGREELG